MLTATTVGSIRAVPELDWNALVGRDDPFFEHGFLAALEDSGAVGEGTGWVPDHVLVHDGARLVGAVPFYEKSDSYGEFIFDWQWADAYLRAGIAYYPKGVVAAPFTPVTGPRLLVHPDQPFDAVADSLVEGMCAYARRRGLSGIHVLFCPREQQEFLAARGFLPRLTYQFHWINRGYACFDDFLSDMRSGKRKDIRKERLQVDRYRLQIELIEGEAVSQEHLDAMWGFYKSTHARKWGEAYLNKDTFQLLAERCRPNLLLVMARDADGWVAGTLNFRKGDAVFGRYWGCSKDYPGLHFECCYYRLIEYAIEHRIGLFEAGAQGEHKFLRGFVTRPTYSSHWIAHPAAGTAIERYLDQERRQMRTTIDGYNRVSPLKYVRAAGA